MAGIASLARITVARHLVVFAGQVAGVVVLVAVNATERLEIPRRRVAVGAFVPFPVVFSAENGEVQLVVLREVRGGSAPSLPIHLLWPFTIPFRWNGGSGYLPTATKMPFLRNDVAGHSRPFLRNDIFVETSKPHRSPSQRDGIFVEITQPAATVPAEQHLHSRR